MSTQLIQLCPHGHMPPWHVAAVSDEADHFPTRHLATPRPCCSAWLRGQCRQFESSFSIDEWGESTEDFRIHEYFHSQDFRNYTHSTSEALPYWSETAAWPLQFATLATPFSPGETLQQLIRMVKLLGLKVGIILHATHAGKDLGMLGSQRCDTKRCEKMVLLDINFPKWSPTSGVELLCPCATCVLYQPHSQGTALGSHFRCFSPLIPLTIS